MTVQVFGVRHHGPGCARNLRAALEGYRPDIVLVEGPPDADALLPMTVDPAMKPPVALLIYRPEAPRRAVFYPFAAFSPEWQAILFALSHQTTVRFFDLPQAIQLADDNDAPDDETAERPEDPLGPDVRLAGDAWASAAGYPDFELWWEEEIERRADPRDLFEAILLAMTALREEAPRPAGREAQREAYMREGIRAAERDGYQRIAVVCGAWHAPALHDRPPARDDRSLLAGLRSTRVDAVWIPWTHSRLSYRSGYGAGITSPGWYEHLWDTGGGSAQERTRPHRTTIDWICRAAHLLRRERLEAPASTIIDAVRLSETLAALRDRHGPGLEELREAIRTSLCNGAEAPMRLIQVQLEVGEVMGAVPANAAAVPLQRDVEAQQRRLRLSASEERRDLDLDLRRAIDLERSHLLHRLQLLEVPWGSLKEVRGKSGTFHEVWWLRWAPDFTIALIDRAIWGNTLVDAAGAFVADAAGREADLETLAHLLQGSLLADLPDAAAAVLAAVRNQAATSPDVQHLMKALPPLAGVARYGDVRGTRVEQVLPVIDGLLERVLVELPGACIALDDDAAAQMLKAMIGVAESISLLDRADLLSGWLGVLGEMALGGLAHPLLRGWCCQSLLHHGVIVGSELQRLAGLSLSPVVPANDAASWIEGMLRDSALMLLNQDPLWTALDGWLRALDAETFAATLPLLRRAFSTFGTVERRAMGDKVRSLAADSGSGASWASNGGRPELDLERAAMVLPILARILGVETGPADGLPRSGARIACQTYVCAWISSCRRLESRAADDR